MCLFAFASRTAAAFVAGSIASYCQHSLIASSMNIKDPVLPAERRCRTNRKKCIERQFVCFDCANHCNVNRPNDVYKHIELGRRRRSGLEDSNRKKLNIHGNNFSGCFRWRAILESVSLLVEWKFRRAAIDFPPSPPPPT